MYVCVFAFVYACVYVYACVGVPVRASVCLHVRWMNIDHELQLSGCVCTRVWAFVLVGICTCLSE